MRPGPTRGIRFMYRPGVPIPSIGTERAIAGAAGRKGRRKSGLTLDLRVREGPAASPLAARWSTLPPMAAPEQDESFMEKLSRQGEEALGKVAEELIANPVVNGAITRAFEARE